MSSSITSPFRLPLALLAPVVLLGGAALAVDRTAPKLDAAGMAVKKGVDAWIAHSDDAAVAAWRPVAEAGDADAQFNLAQAYKLGRGVPQDLKMAEVWYRKAAVQGHEQAQATLGLIMFQNGDRIGAMPWLQQAADRGEPRAQYVYGTALFNGDGVTKDWARAYAMMTRAAATGLPQAKASLTQMDQFIPLAQRQQGTALAAAPRPTAFASASRTPPAPPVPRATPPVRTAPPPAPRVAETAEATQPMPRAAATPRPAPAPKAVPAPKPAPVAAATPSAGGKWRVQLGAFGNQAGAETLWKSIAAKAPGLRAAQPFYVKAGAMTRLQAGPFATREAASAACRGAASCFPVAP